MPSEKVDHAREARYFDQVASTLREVVDAATELRSHPIGLEPIDNRVRNSTLDSVIDKLTRQAEAFDNEANTHRFKGGAAIK
jgi:hypothetical protein